VPPVADIKISAKSKPVCDISTACVHQTFIGNGLFRDHLAAYCVAKEFNVNPHKEVAMRVHEAMFDEFFKHRLPDEGFTLEEVYDEYFGLIEAMQNSRTELHGHVVTMDGTIVVPTFGHTVRGITHHQQPTNTGGYHGRS
jgi:hypothetical protein